MGTKKLTYILSFALVLIIVPLLIFNFIHDKEQADQSKAQVTNESTNMTEKPVQELKEETVEQEDTVSKTEKDEAKSTSKKESEQPQPKAQPQTQKETKTASESTGESDTKPSIQAETPNEKEVDTVTIKVIGPEERGVILPSRKITYKDGDTVLSSLLSASKGNFEVEYSGSGTMAYVEGIDDIFEFDYGPTSGWLCYLNGKALPKSSGAVKVKKGDLIEWKYTKDFGAGS